VTLQAIPLNAPLPAKFTAPFGFSEKLPLTLMIAKLLVPIPSEAYFGKNCDHSGNNTIPDVRLRVAMERKRTLRL
jgi:hypothetical protein